MTVGVDASCRNAEWTLGVETAYRRERCSASRWPIVEPEIEAGVALCPAEDPVSVLSVVLRSSFSEHHPD